MWWLLPPVLVLGIGSAVARALILNGHASGATDLPRVISNTLFPRYAAELLRLEAHYAAISAVTLIHVVVGGSFMGLGAMQFSRTIRTRHPRVHRASGWVLVVMALVVGPTGIWMGVVAPFSATERPPTAALGAVFLVSMMMAIAAIRHGDVARHREWMIRFYAAAFAVVLVRLMAPVVLSVLRPATFSEVVGITFWAGAIGAQAAAELWIRATRARPLRIAIA